jgi:diguanylate cyclase (GGDEF)-like protein
VNPVVEQRVRVLVVGPGQRVRDAADAWARPADVQTCAEAAEASARLRDGGADLVVCELAPGDAAERSALIAAIESDPTDACWLVVAGSDDADECAALCAAGADECLPAGVDPAALSRLGLRLLEDQRLRAENRFLRETIRIMEDCRPLAHCLEPGQLYPMCLDLLIRATERRRGLALFRREGLPQSDAVAVRGLPDDEASRVCRALIDDKPVDVDGFHGIGVLDRGPLHDAIRAADVALGTLLTVSFGGEGRESGIAVIFDDGRPFTAEDVERADIVARHGISALANAGTYAMAKERAFIDDVTEAYNARYLLSTVENEIQRAERYGNPLSVLFLDLDRFKTVNDEYGHLVGSETLRRLSRLLEQCVRQVDTLARYGGDEFTIVLVDTAHDAAMRIAERIRHTIEDHVFEIGREARLSLTISIGVATCPDHGTSRDQILDAADKAMYRAKSEGRNRVSSAADLG